MVVYSEKLGLVIIIVLVCQLGAQVCGVCLCYAQFTFCVSRQMRSPRRLERPERQRQVERSRTKHTVPASNAHTHTVPKSNSVSEWE